MKTIHPQHDSIRRLFSIFLSLFFLSFSFFTYGQETYLQNREIPLKIKQYTKTYFPNNNIAYVKKDIDHGILEYKVQLKLNDTELSFNKNLKPIKIESHKELPRKVISYKIWNYIQKHYPRQKVVEWELKNNYQEVGLNNHVDLLFNLKGDFIKKKL
ncbi:PepSY-like domain-containing protein [Elizabethkingia sp. JS20170427COW]|uniref:PepSY-like domain-containing protein n=1 Tax=Elizabethkingia sp. JS20170427COW TaxID=2583851 RepID=UPI0011102268|nr:PepSY-like domain-containing protein [Elizabethkingia sp. JS20170427COW]QCX53685.1 hypothetical protein FGE20_08060 [Elizabethkingia sp. JS20170427COW]